jgi:transposase-like protein
MARKTRKGPGRKGYSPAVKAKILTTAKKENLTGAEVKKRFGISTLTFYRWRGPVRGKKRGPGRPKGKGLTKPQIAAARRKIRTQLKKLLPQIIREEVGKALKGL